MSNTTYVRVNIAFDDIFQTNGVYILNNGSFPTYTYIRIYGSNTDSDYTSSNLNIDSTCVSLSTQQIYNGNLRFIATSDTNLYKYIIVLFTQGQAYNYLSVQIQCMRINGGFIQLSSPNDFTVSTGTYTGYPLITSKLSNTSNLSCNLQGLAVYECYRRVVSVIRGKDTINLYNSVINNNYIINYNDSGNLILGNTITINTGGVISGATWGGGIIPLNKGGTNSSSFTNNSLLYSNSTSILSLGSGLSNQHLISNGSGNLPSWSSTWSGDIIPVNKGGTGTSSLTSGCVLIGNGTSAIQPLFSGYYSQYLMSFGNTSSPAFTSDWKGSVIQVSKGGTGNNTFSSGQILVGNGASSIVTLNPGSNNQFLMSQGSNLPPIFTNTFQFPDNINTSGKLNGSILRYNTTNARWETPGNVNVDDTGKMQCYALQTNSVQIP